MSVGNHAFGDPRTAAVRIPPTTSSADSATRPLPEQSSRRSAPFDPSAVTAATLVSDPVFGAIHGKWRDQQQHGRVQYDAMLRHPEVAAAFKARLSFLTANPPRFRPRASDASPKQKEIADFANHILSLLEWPYFIDGPIGQAFQYGFTLSEITTKVAKWRGKDMVVLDELVQLPQATLDHGFIPREEFGELYLSSNPRYRCFTFDAKGRITGIHQYHSSYGPGEAAQSWVGNEMKQILHVRIGGGDGNPFGHSALHAAYYPWSELYSTEQIAGVHRDTSLPWLFGTYKTANNEGQPRHLIHDEVTDIIQKQHPSSSRRLLMWPDGDLKSVSPVTADWTKERESAEKRLTRQLWKAMLVPQGLISETDDSESDVRNLLQVYFKHLLKADLSYVSYALDDLVTRIVESNYGFLDSEDRPELQWAVTTENELRVTQALLGQAMPYVASDKLGALLHRIAPSVFDADMIPESHGDSVELLRPRRDSNDEPNTVTGDPPEKQPGEDRVREDGDTANPSTEMNTDV